MDQEQKKEEVLSEQDMDQEQIKEEFSEQDQDEETSFSLLDAAIDFKLKGFYPEGLSADQKRSVRRKAKTISVEHGEAFILKKKGKVI